jgi:hypothetical protein
VIGERDARGTVIGSAAAETVDSASPVEERILRVNVKMDETIQAGFLRALTGRRHSASSVPGPALRFFDNLLKSWGATAGENSIR